MYPNARVPQGWARGYEASRCVCVQRRAAAAGGCAAAAAARLVERVEVHRVLARLRRREVVAAHGAEAAGRAVVALVLAQLRAGGEVPARAPDRGRWRLRAGSNGGAARRKGDRHASATHQATMGLSGAAHATSTACASMAAARFSRGGRCGGRDATGTWLGAVRYY